MFAIVTVALCSGFIYWMIFFFRKVWPDFRYDLKYKVFRKKYNEKEVARLWDYLQADLSKDDVYKFLLTNGIDNKRAKELKYIYKQMKIKKMKGGEKNGE